MVRSIVFSLLQSLWYRHRKLVIVLRRPEWLLTRLRTALMTSGLFWYLHKGSKVQRPAPVIRTL